MAQTPLLILGLIELLKRLQLLRSYDIQICFARPDVFQKVRKLELRLRTLKVVETLVEI
jgi:hypothetical protein